MQAIIGKYVCGERSTDYDKDEDGIEAIEIICDPEKTSIDISHTEALGMLDQLLHVNGISEIDCTSLLKKKWKPCSSAVRSEPQSRIPFYEVYEGLG